MNINSINTLVNSYESFIEYDNQEFLKLLDSISRDQILEYISDIEFTLNFFKR